MARRRRFRSGGRFRGYYRRFRGYAFRQWNRAKGFWGSWANRKFIGPIKYKHLAFAALGVCAVLVAFAVKVLRNDGVTTFEGAKEAIRREMKKTKPKLDNNNKNDK